MSYGNQYQNNPYGSAEQNNPYAQAEQGYSHGGQVSSIDGDGIGPGSPRDCFGVSSASAVNNSDELILSYQEHELQSYPQQQQSNLTLSQQDFLQRISHLREQVGTLTTNVQAIASLHQRALAESDGGLSAQQLERLVAETQGLNQGIRDQLKFLATDASRTTDGSKSLKDQQVNTLKNNFERELRAYQQEESQYRQRYRDQIARQYRIVNPDATEDEVRQATEADWGNEGVFQTAVCAYSLRSGDPVLMTLVATHEPHRTSYFCTGQRSRSSQ